METKKTWAVSLILCLFMVTGGILAGIKAINLNDNIKLIAAVISTIIFLTFIVGLILVRIKQIKN